MKDRVDALPGGRDVQMVDKRAEHFNDAEGAVAFGVEFGFWADRFDICTFQPNLVAYFEGLEVVSTIAMMILHEVSSSSHSGLGVGADGFKSVKTIIECRNVAIGDESQIEVRVYTVKVLEGRDSCGRVCARVMDELSDG